MDIYILREGKEIGPFNETKTHTLLNQGSIGMHDLSWCPGMSKWLPLCEVMSSLPSEAAERAESFTPPDSEGAPAEVSDAPFESATRKQRALLAFLGIAVEDVLSRTQAALIISDAMEDAACSGRFSQWQAERLTLHPDLFAAEIQAKREGRADHFHRLAHTEGAAYFVNFAKPHAQALVSYLDLSFPTWDAKEATAARDYFFPAIAEKFPQHVKPEWQGRLHYPTGVKGTPELAGPSAVLRPRPARSGGLPILAMARGIFFGLLILGVAWFARKKLTGPDAKAAGPIAAPSEKTAASAPTATDMPNAPSTTADAAPPAPATAPAESPEAMKTPEAGATSSGEMTAAPAPPTPAAPAADSAPVARTVPSALPAPLTPIRLTKPAEVKLAFGKVVLPAGTTVKFLAQEGPWLRVQYINDAIYIPATSTNLSDLPPAPAAEPGLMPAPPTPTTPDPLAPPKPAKDSLFGDLPTPAPTPPAPPL